jgi:acetyl esterase/lipase
MVVAAIEFRKAPEHPYPAQVQDTNYAVRWLKLHAADYNIDPTRFGGAGDSSGGHTMLLNAMRPDDPFYTALPLDGGGDVDASVAYVIAMWAVLDPFTRYFYAKGMGRTDMVKRTEDYFLTTAAMKQANPQMILERRERAVLPPVLIIQGDTDDNIPNCLPMMFEEAYSAAGGSVQLEWFRGMGHSFAREPGEHGDRAIEVMREFVAQQTAAPRE